jgi:hypothetical protein
LPGDKAYGENASTPIECFQHFIDEEVIAYIVGNTNYTIAETKWKKTRKQGVFKYYINNLIGCKDSSFHYIPVIKY